MREVLLKMAEALELDMKAQQLEAESLQQVKSAIAGYIAIADANTNKELKMEDAEGTKQWKQ